LEKASTTSDFIRIAELNAQYADLPADFADLSLVALAERLMIGDIASPDKEFDIYKLKQGNSLIRFRRMKMS
jgi:predicted nucleic acid-binding protein